MWSEFPWPWPIARIPWDVISNGSSTNCTQELHVKYLLEVVVLAAAGALVLLFNLPHPSKLSSCYKTNLSCYKIKTSLSSWLQNVAIPVDFLLVTPYRLIYCVTLSLWAADVCQDILNPDLFYRSSDGLVDALLYFGVTPTIIILRQALIYFPVLACVNSSIPILTHYTGFFYTLLIGVYRVYSEAVLIRGCSSRGQLIPRDIGISLGVVVPVYLGYVGVACWFFCRASMATALTLFVGKTEPCKAEVYKQHVRKLLKDWKKHEAYNSKTQLLQNLVRGFQYVLPFKFNPQIKLPLPFMAALFMTFTLLYQMCILLVSHEQIVMGNAREFIDSFNITVETLKGVFPVQAHQLDTLFYDAKGLAQTMQVLFPLAHWTGGTLTVFFTAYMIQNFHKHMLRMARGDLSFLVASEPLPSAPHCLAAMMRYIPFQVGYILVCFIVYSLITLILGLIGWGYYYLFKNHTYYGTHYWCWFTIPYVWSSALHILQLLLCKHVFLGKQEGVSLDGANWNGNQPSVKIRFRHLYMLVTYLVLFFNIIYSVAFCILRVLVSFIFTVVMLFRLDRDVYMRGLEGWDLGHRIYVGYLYLEYCTNNAVVVTFVDLLNTSLHTRGRKGVGLATPTETYIIQNHDRCTDDEVKEGAGDFEKELSPESNGVVVRRHSKSYSAIPNHCSASLLAIKSRRACNRWLVAYTLLRNPGLQHLTSSSMQQGLPHQAGAENNTPLNSS